MIRTDYSTITVSGDEAFDFLQAQLAADLAELNGAASPSDHHAREHHQDELPQSILSAWCNPKGRVICLFRVGREGDDYTLSLPSGLVDSVLQRLTLFRFRAKVEFSVTEATDKQLGIATSFDDWRLANLRAGIPEILEAESEQFTPHMLNLDLLGAASVDKGCYPGQEIVARTHFRGSTKRRMLRFESEAPVSAGDKVTEAGRPVGDVVNAIGRNLLAVVPLAKADADLMVDGIPLTQRQLPYLR